METMKGLVTHGDSGELFLFEAAGPGKTLSGPTLEINGLLYVEAMKGLVPYGYNGKLFLFDAQALARGRRPAEHALNATIVSFLLQALFITISLGQILGAAYKSVRPPSTLKTPAKCLKVCSTWASTRGHGTQRASMQT